LRGEPDDGIAHETRHLAHFPRSAPRIAAPRA